jgi:hypothetical protein
MPKKKETKHQSQNHKNRKGVYLLFDTFEKGRTFLLHCRRPLFVLLFQFGSGLHRVPERFHFEFVREAETVVQHRQSFLDEL